jgi:hypothetical protein
VPIAGKDSRSDVREAAGSARPAKSPREIEIYFERYFHTNSGPEESAILLNPATASWTV